ncbi:MAG: cyclopropane-fatty-acyl-phospholipid synthase [Pseudomonadota bacterium]
MSAQLDHSNDLKTAKRAAAVAPPEVLQAMLRGTGVSFNGSQPWDIQVHDAEFYHRVLAQGSLGFGEAYMDGLWDCERLDEMFDRLLRADLDHKVRHLNRLHWLAESLRWRLFNYQSRRRAFQVGEQHYDIGNDIFEAMLDPSMSYSCAYWASADNLGQAQLDKLDLICRKLQLQPGERLLDIGCGWGGLARHAAANYGVRVHGITVSREQQRLARERCAGLPVEIELCDYRDLQGRFDKIVSVGMFEHVGRKNYRAYFDTAARLLSDDGIFLLHTIGDYADDPVTDPWIVKYIFPNGQLPSARQLSGAVQGHFLIEDWHNFGTDYDKTLMAWWANFAAAWPSLAERYEERFRRMWHYYLMSCAGFFRSRKGQLWQLVLTKPQRAQVYRSLR